MPSKLAVAVVCMSATSSGLYEAPRGGCQAPPDDASEPFPQQRAVPRPAARPKPPPPPPPPPPPADPAELERQLYERESVAQLAGLGGDDEDWDAIERGHLREQNLRQGLSGAVVVLGMLFAAYKILTHARGQRGYNTDQKQRMSDTKASAPADATVKEPAQPTPAAPAPAGSAPDAANDNAEDLRPAAAPASAPAGAAEDDDESEEGVVVDAADAEDADEDAGEECNETEAPEAAEETQKEAEANKQVERAEQELADKTTE